jgi:hypothetical protein
MSTYSPHSQSGNTHVDVRVSEIGDELGVHLDHGAIPRVGSIPDTRDEKTKDAENDEVVNQLDHDGASNRLGKYCHRALS